MTLEQFCGGPFWDTNLTWYSAIPDVTSCFQQTTLVWIPAFFLWSALFVYGAYLYHRTTQPTPRCFINVAKIVVVSVLALFACIDIIITLIRRNEGNVVPDVYLVSPAITGTTFLLAIGLAEVERRKGFFTSGVLFFFWLLHLLTGCIRLYSHISRWATERPDPHPPVVVSFYIQFTLVLLQAVLTCFSEAPQELQDNKQCPEYRESFLSRITYSWLTRLVWTGYRKPLEEDDVWALHPADKAAETGAELHAAWQNQLHKSNCGNGSVLSEASNYPTPEQEVKVHGRQKAPSLLYAMASVYFWPLVQSHLCKLVCDVLMFTGPLLQRELIRFTTDKTVLMWKGYFYAILFFLTAIANSFFFQQLYHFGYKLGARVKSAILTEIYKKSLTLSNESCKETTTLGEIDNLMIVDAQILQDLTPYLWMVWSSPLQIIIAVVFLWQLLGPPALAGLLLVFLLLPANVVLLKFQRKLHERQMKYKDERTNLMKDILNGIKVLKLYAWELSFKEKIEEIRNLELTSLKHYSYLGAGQTFTWTLAPFGVMLATITTYVLSGNELDAETAFVALSLFNLLHFPINLLPQIMTTINKADISITRIQKFLSQPDLDTGNVTHEDLGDPITLSNATLSWGSAATETPVLNNVSMTVQENQFVAVVGMIGSGKSSLISAMLGDLLKLSGSLNVKGQIAYAAQEPWIQAGTVRYNITFGKEFFERKYNKIIEACALKADFDMLPGGDLTEIGEKGINLSGGQRQRVSLARAAYSTTEAQIYLLDDPLSAVDSHVGKHIFDQLLGKTGLLRNKVRVMVTHGLHWLPRVDHIIVLENGEISEQGSYDFLLSRDGPLARLVKTYMSDEQKEDVLEGSIPDEIIEVRKKMLQRVESLPLGDTSVRDSVEQTFVMKRLSNQKSLPNRQLPRYSKSISSTTQIWRDSFAEMERFRRSVRETMKEKGNTVSEETSGNLIKNEQREVGSVKFSVFLTYGRAMGLINTAIMLMGYTFYAALAVMSNLWVSKWTSDNNTHLAPDSEEYISSRNVYLGIYGGLGLFQGLFVLLYAVVAAISVVRASRNLHEAMLTNILRCPMSFFDTTPTSRVINRFSGDVNTVDTEVPKAITMWIQAFFSVISGLVVISYSTPWFLVPIILLTLVYLLVLCFYIPTYRQLKRLELTSRPPIVAQFSEMVKGASTIRAYCQSERFLDDSNEHVDRNQVYYLANMAANRWLGFRLDMLSAFVVLGAALLAVLGRDWLTGGIVGLSISYALYATSQFNWLVQTTCDLEAKMVSIERLKEYSHLKEEKPWQNDETAPDDNWPANGAITFEDYGVRYRPELDLVLRGIKADIRAGERVGIVGRTGAGKSSLTLGLFRIMESSKGCIKIDGIDIAQLGLHQLRSKITILPQETMMFGGTIRANLDPLGHFNDDTLYEVLEKAHLLDLVNSLPEELSFEVGEGGHNLSVGQRQLVGLARAMLYKSRVLILDEATAAVDLQTDDLIQKTIQSEFRETTILTIAHRLNTIMDYDRIMVLDQGKVSEFASPSELLQNTKGIFYSMAKDAGISMENRTQL